MNKKKINIEKCGNEAEYIGRTITVHLSTDNPPNITILTNVLTEVEMGSILLAVASDLLGVDTKDLMERIRFRNNFER